MLLALTTDDRFRARLSGKFGDCCGDVDDMEELCGTSITEGPTEARRTRLGAGRFKLQRKCKCISVEVEAGKYFVTHSVLMAMFSGSCWEREPMMTCRGTAKYLFCHDSGAFLG